MINTTFTPNSCDICGTAKITLDERYDLPPCHNFILLCPDHPADVSFDLSSDDLQNIVNSNSK